MKTGDREAEGVEDVSVELNRVWGAEVHHNFLRFLFFEERIEQSKLLISIDNDVSLLETFHINMFDILLSRADADWLFHR